MAEHLARVYGTEDDKVNCSFYHKMGACRHGAQCGRQHNKPVLSQTLLLAHLYANPLAVHGAYTGLVSGDWRFGVTDAEVRVLEPIETAGLTMNDLTDLKHRAHAAIAGALEDMKAGA